MTPENRNCSPGRLTARRFIRSRLAVVGLILLAFLFLFSFLGGLISPYRQDQVFYREAHQKKSVAAVTVNDRFYFTPAPGQAADPVLEAQLLLSLRTGQTVSYKESTYHSEAFGPELYRIYRDGDLWGLAHKVLLQDTQSQDFSLLTRVLTAYADGESSFSLDGKPYRLEEDGTLLKENFPAALHKLKEMGVSTWAVIHCPEVGMGLDENNDLVEVPSLKLPKGWIAGTVGAGDAFCSGVTYAAWKGESLKSAIELGTASAVCSLSAPGSTEGMRSEQEARALYASMR